MGRPEPVEGEFRLPDPVQPPPVELVYAGSQGLGFSTTWEKRAGGRSTHQAHNPCESGLSHGRPPRRTPATAPVLHEKRLDGTRPRYKPRQPALSLPKG